MSELTSLTLAEALRGLSEKRVSSVEMANRVRSTSALRSAAESWNLWLKPAPVSCGKSSAGRQPSLNWERPERSVSTDEPPSQSSSIWAPSGSLRTIS